MKLIPKLIFLLFISSIGITTAQSNYIAGQLVGNAPGINPATSTSVCDTVFSFPGIDSWVSGIAYDGTYLWSCGYTLSYFYKHDLSGTLIDSVLHPVPISSFPKGGDLDFDGTNIWFFQEETDSLYKIDPSSGAVISSFRISTCSTDCYGVAYDGTNLWISNYSPQELYKVDPATGTVLNSFSISTSSNMLPIKFINGKLYGLGVFPGVIYEIDTANGNVLNSTPWCLGFPLGLCIADNHMWGSSSQVVNGGTRRIYQFDSLWLGDNDINSNLSIDIYPNPSVGSFHISFDKEITNGTIEVIGILGQTILKSEFESESELTFDLSGYSAGVYFIKVFDDRNYSVKKLILENK